MISSHFYLILKKKCQLYDFIYQSHTVCGGKRESKQHYKQIVAPFAAQRGKTAKIKRQSHEKLKVLASRELVRAQF